MLKHIAMAAVLSAAGYLHAASAAVMSDDFSFNVDEVSRNPDSQRPSAPAGTNYDFFAIDDWSAVVSFDPDAVDTDGNPNDSSATFHTGHLKLTNAAGDIVGDTFNFMSTIFNGVGTNPDFIQMKGERAIAGGPYTEELTFSFSLVGVFPPGAALSLAAVRDALVSADLAPVETTGRFQYTLFENGTLFRNRDPFTVVQSSFPDDVGDPVPLPAAAPLFLAAVAGYRFFARKR